MKARVMFTLILLSVLSAGTFAQSRFAVGLIGTRFGNTASDSKLTEIKNPLGYGFIAAYSVTKELSVAFTGEYFKSDTENNNGNERDLRGHISAFLAPFSLEVVRPYISAGVVYTDRKLESAVNSKSDGVVNARFGAGVDCHLIQNLSINLDFGVYNNGMNVVGWSNSIGLRYGLNIQ